jgi:flavin reductase (DIM6/NTAB) family NADH-FMN oxidoreductase RutF
VVAGRQPADEPARARENGSGDLELGLDSLDQGTRYLLLTAIVVPRPIAWVSTVDRAGNRNLAPYSYFNICSVTPPIVHFTSIEAKHSIANVRETEEFVINIVSSDLAEAMCISSAEFPHGEDEFGWAKLDATASVRVRPPRVRRAKVALECRLRKLVEMGEGTMAFGDVLHVHLDRSVSSDGRVDPVLLAPVGKLSDTHYTTVTDVYDLEIPQEVERQVQDCRIDSSPAGPRSPVRRGAV